MNLNKTEVLLLVDSSGSMFSAAKDSNDGIAHFIKEQASLPGECVLSLIDFDTKARDVIWRENIQNAPEYAMQPGGGTAYLDALGDAIARLGKELAAEREEDRPGKVILFVVTDGDDNSSHEYTLDTVKSMVQHQEQIYSWNFIFLGANINTQEVGKSLGINEAASVSYSTRNSRQVYETVSRSLGNLRCAVSKGEQVTYNSLITDEDREALNS